MNVNAKLFIIKLVHTVIWCLFVIMIFYIVYSGIVNKITIFTWLFIAFVLLEGGILLLFSWRCPLTLVARRYSDSSKDNFDIFLPLFIARYNKWIFTTIYLIGLCIVGYRVLA